MIQENIPILTVNKNSKNNNYIFYLNCAILIITYIFTKLAKSIRSKEKLKVAELAVPHALKHRRRAAPAYGMARKRWQAGSKRLNMVEAPSIRQAQGAGRQSHFFYISTKQSLNLGFI